MLKDGGIQEQPDWFADLLAWIIPRLDMAKFTSKVAMVMGKGSPSDKTKALFKAAVRGGGSARGGGHGGRYK